jgi:hypothetical protein
MLLPREIFVIKEVRLVFSVRLVLLQVLEHLVETGVSHAVWGEDVSWGIAEGLLDVVILEIDEFLILYSTFWDLSVEEGGEGSGDA